LHIAAWVRFLLVSSLAVGSAAAGEPLDLGDLRARPVRVAFEISPPELPAQLDHHYSDLAPAWFEPGPGPSQATVRVSGHDFEKVIESFDPVPGSFGDFVWVFDVETGHVVSASLSGAVQQQLQWGFLKTRVRADIETHLTTLRASGFQTPRATLGQLVFEHCDERDPDCQLVALRAFDHVTGYVNAVGSISAKTVGGLETQSFCPLGEALFSEMPADTAVSAR